ncbi:MAG: hypothetical protein ABI417_08480 [Coleofasciculaceae cyanobacterium]
MLKHRTSIGFLEVVKRTIRRDETSNKLSDAGNSAFEAEDKHTCHEWLSTNNLTKTQLLLIL